MSMTNREIMEMMVEDEQYYSVIENINEGDGLEDELWTDVLLIIGEYDNDKLNDMIDKGKFKFFFVRVCLNQYKSENSPFYKKYKKYDRSKSYDDIAFDEDGQEVDSVQNVINKHSSKVTNEDYISPLSDYIDWESDNPMKELDYHEKITKITEKILQDMYWYDEDLFRIYVRLGSYRKVAKETGIPFGSVATDLKRIREKIQNKINRYLLQEETPIKERTGQWNY